MRSPKKEVKKEANETDTITWKILVGFIIAVLTAVTTWGINFVEQRRKDRLQFVSSQIEKLYGPLFAYSQRNGIIWTAFHNQYWKERNEFFSRNHVTKPDDIGLWRRWMTDVFQPMNVEAATAISANTHLLVEKICR